MLNFFFDQEVASKSFFASMLDNIDISKLQKLHMAAIVIRCIDFP